MDINSITTGEWIAITAFMFLIYQLIEKFVFPVFKAKINIERNSHKVREIDALKKSFEDYREESRTTDKLLVKAMVAIIDNRITGNNVEHLKTTKSDLMTFLTT